MTSAQLQNVFFLAVLFCTTGLFLWMLGSYLFPVLWAVIITVVFYPVYAWLFRILKNESAASVLTIAVAALVIVVPIIFVGGLVIRESLGLYQSVQNGITDETMDGFIARIDSVLPVTIDWEQAEARAREGLAGLTAAITGSLLQYSQFTLGFVAKIGIMLYVLFFMFRYNTVLLDKAAAYLPMNEKYLKLLFERFASTTQAIAQGTLTIAILQGTIGALTLWLVGIGAPVLWGVVMTILSIIPAVGPSFVLVPAGVYLIVTGSLVQGIIVLGVGVVLIGLVDEFLRPLLVGRRAKIPDAIVLLATVGGLSTFGVTGFVIGPVIAAFCLSLWAIFSEKYKKAT